MCVTCCSTGLYNRNNAEATSGTRLMIQEDGSRIDPVMGVAESRQLKAARPPAFASSGPQS